MRRLPRNDNRVGAELNHEFLGCWADRTSSGSEAALQITEQPGRGVIGIGNKAEIYYLFCFFASHEICNCWRMEVS